MTQFIVKHWFGVVLSILFAVAVSVGAVQYQRHSQLLQAKTRDIQPAAGGKPSRAWNVALGDVVIVAKELGFKITAENDASIDRDRLLSRIETQLQPLRALYRQAVADDPSLMGITILRFDVSKDGAITDVTEIATRLTNEDFRKAVLDEAANWSLQHYIRTAATIDCPLLFVREGMDLTTLVQWEKALSTTKAATAVAKSSTDEYAIKRSSKTKSANRDADTHESAKGKSAAGAASSNEKSFRIKYVVPLRSEPNFSSEHVTTLTIGTRVKIIKRLGDWLEVNSSDGQFSGYLRKEFIS